MNILHVIPAISPRYGGPSFVIRALCCALSKLEDTSIVLVTTDADGSGRKLAQELVPDSFAVHVLPTTFSERWKYSRAMSRWLRQNIMRFDVVHIHALWTHASAAAARAAMQFDVPYIVRPAGMLSDYSLSHRALTKWLYWSLIERTSMRGASCFHATSRLEADDILRVLPDAKVSVISNGVDAQAWQTGRDSVLLRQLTGRAGDPRPLLLFLSRLHRKKGIVDLLLPAFAKMKSPALLAIVGGPDEHDRGYEHIVRYRINELRLGDRVHLLGASSPERRWQMFDGADAFVLPSHSENFGIVVAEAMSRQCPVVITEGVQCCDHVVAAGAGLVVRNDVEALTQALDQMVSNEAARKRMGCAGLSYAQSHFCWDHIAIQIRTMYTDVIDHHSARAVCKAR